MRHAKLIRVYHYIDTSWGKSASTCISWTTPSGRPKSKSLYGAGFWTQQEAQIWLDGKYRRRLSNLFGLLWYI